MADKERMMLFFNCSCSAHKSDFSHHAELNSSSQKRKTSHCEVLLPGVVRRTFYVLYGDSVQWSVSERFSSYPEVELGLTGPTSISTNIRTTCSKSLAVFVSNDSSLSVRPRILTFIYCFYGSVSNDLDDQY